MYIRKVISLTCNYINRLKQEIMKRTFRTLALLSIYLVGLSLLFTNDLAIMSIGALVSVTSLFLLSRKQLKQ